MQKEPRLPEGVRQWKGERGMTKRIERSWPPETLLRETNNLDLHKDQRRTLLEFAPQYEVTRWFSRNSWYVIASWWYKIAQRDRRWRGRETVCRFTTLLSANAIQTCCVVLKERLPITFRILVDGCLLSPPSLALTIFTISRLVPPLSISKSTNHLFQAVASQD